MVTVGKLFASYPLKTRWMWFQLRAFQVSSSHNEYLAGGCQINILWLEWEWHVIDRNIRTCTGREDIPENIKRATHWSHLYSKVI